MIRPVLAARQRRELRPRSKPRPASCTVDDFHFLTLALVALEGAQIITEPERLDTDDQHGGPALGAERAIHPLGGMRCVFRARGHAFLHCRRERDRSLSHRCLSGEPWPVMERSYDHIEEICCVIVVAANLTRNSPARACWQCYRRAGFVTLLQHFSHGPMLSKLRYHLPRLFFEPTEILGGLLQPRRRT
jgi:hypothetical protein